MKITRIFISILIFLVLLIFFVRNLNQQVNIVLLDRDNPIKSEFVVVLVITFGVGLLIGFSLAVIQILALKNRLRIRENELNNLKKELNDLRNLAVQEGLIKTDETQKE